MNECKWCHGNSVTIYGDATDLEIDGKHAVIKAWGDDLASQKINFCPMCGRKLGGDNANIQ